MRRFYSIAFLFILLANSAGFYVYYVVQLQQIRNEMRAALKNLPENELDVLHMTRAEFTEALVEDHEVKVHGKMYDIARITESGSTVTVYCKHDEREDDLMALLDHVLSVPINKKDAFPSVVSEFIGLNFITPFFLIVLLPYLLLSISYTHYRFSVKTSVLVPITHPPCL